MEEGKRKYMKNNPRPTKYRPLTTTILLLLLVTIYKVINTVQTCTNRITRTTFVITILYINTIFFNKDTTLLNDNTFIYIPKSKQWDTLKNLKNGVLTS